MLSFSDNNIAVVVEAINCTTRYLDDLFPFLDEDVPRSHSYGVYISGISQLIHLARVSSTVGVTSTKETNF